jgi:RNA polymerase sigma factor (TIGR02999 family)
MDMDLDDDVTRLLNVWREGSKDVLDKLIPLIYEELRRIAAAHLRRERPDHTLQPTALIHEAYLRLVQGNQPVWHSRVHFYAIASRIMRQVLVDTARKHQAVKRGQGAKADLNDAMAVVWERDVELLELDDALKALAQTDDRMCKVIEMKYFGGLTREEIAEVTRTSEATVGRDLRLAEAWLRRKMGVARK